MIRLLLPAVLSLCVGGGATAQAHTSCAPAEDQSDCVRVVACVGEEGLWFNGRAFGRGAGDFSGALSDGTACTGTWMSRNFLGLGQADVACENGMTGRVYYTYQDSYTGTALGQGLANDGRRIRIWSGTNVLAYLRGQTGEPVATLPCTPEGIPMSDLVVGLGLFTDHIAAVAIGTFDPAAVMRDRQPDAGVTERAFATVTRNTPLVDDLGFGGGNGHNWAYLWLPRDVTRFRSG